MSARRVGSLTIPARGAPPPKRGAKEDAWRQDVARRFKRHLDGLGTVREVSDPDEEVVVSKLPQRPTPRFGPWNDDY